MKKIILALMVIFSITTNAQPKLKDFKMGDETLGYFSVQDGLDVIILTKEVSTFKFDQIKSLNPGYAVIYERGLARKIYKAKQLAKVKSRTLTRRDYLIRAGKRKKAATAIAMGGNALGLAIIQINRPLGGLIIVGSSALSVAVNNEANNDIIKAGLAE